MNKKITPELVCELPVFAASGLVIRHGYFYIISDDEISLIHGTPSLGFEKYIFWDEELPEDPALRKKLKPDFECLYLSGASLFILPSFSRKNRVTGVRVDLAQDTIVGHTILELSDVLEKLDKEIFEVNIEGAIQRKDELLLFQRGNGKKGKNAVIIQKDFSDRNFKVIPIEVPSLGKIPVTITDATSWENEIWFLAVAEDTTSTYSDGEVVGSFLGKLDENFKLVDLIQLDFPHKPEGLSFSLDGYLYLVTDDDSREKPSRLFRLKV